MPYIEVPAVNSKSKAEPGLCKLYVVDMNDLISVPAADATTRVVSTFPSLISGKNFQPWDARFKESDLVENASDNDLYESIVNVQIMGDLATNRATFSHMYGHGNNKYALILEYPRQVGETEPKRLIGFNYSFDANYASGKTASSDFKGYTARFFKYGESMYNFTAQFPSA